MPQWIIAAYVQRVQANGREKAKAALTGPAATIDNEPSGLRRWKIAEELVLTTIAGHVATLILNRPDKRNALSPELLSVLTAQLMELRDNPEVRCVVIRGTGRQAFSAGFDIGRLGESSAQPGSDRPQGESQPSRPNNLIHEFPYPVIAMIYGYCVGAGLELAVACDLRIAAEDAKLGITPAKLGIVYSHDPIKDLVALIGPAFTKEMFFTGRLVDAQRAYAMGLVNQVSPAEALETFTYALAEEIAHNAPLSVRGSKAAVRRILDGSPLTPEEEARFLALQQEANFSEDLAEGRRAFFERRKPQFKGK